MNFPVHQPFAIFDRLQARKVAIPDAVLALSLKTAVNWGPFSVALWQISPRGSHA